MKKKIFRSVIAVAMTVLLASLVISTGLLYRYFNNFQVSQLKDALNFASSVVQNTKENAFETLDGSSYRFTWIASDGTVIFDTYADPNTMENHLSRDEVKQAFDYGKGSSERYSSTLTEKTLYEAVKLNDGTVLRVSISQKTVSALLFSMLPAVILVIFLAALVSMVLANRTAANIIEPLNSLDLEHPAKNDVYEELAPVLTKLNQQRRQISEQVGVLRQKTDEFEQITSSMREGLMLLDGSGKILSMNRAAAEIFSCKEDSRGTGFLTVDRSAEMREAVSKALNGTHSEFQAERGGRRYQFSVNGIRSDEQLLGTVILGFDVTERVYAERNRREFTANVTHELKTPLQSILGSAELLEKGLVKPEDTQRFLGNIKSEAARLVTLINDIIRLSQLDENNQEVGESVELLALAGEVAQVLSASAEKKNVTMLVEGEACTIHGVRRYLYEILYNLCDNAIRYNVENGSVTVRIGKKDGRPYLCVSDTGIGIPPEHHARIFERFYRVDKSHSKENGGTGLGLSIVYHAVRYHGGKISLKSQPGNGTAITITF